jgi:hypothetical protein
MGYYIRNLKRKKNRPTWKAQFISYKAKDQRENPMAKEPKRAWDISKERWRALGLHPNMSPDEARARTKQLDAQLHLKRQEQRLKQIKDKQIIFQLRNEAALLRGVRCRI